MFTSSARCRAFACLLLGLLPALAGCRGPAWAPDGKSLALAAGGVLRIFQVEGARFTTLPTQGGYIFNPTYSPDGKRLAYLAIRPGPNGTLESCDLWVREVAGGSERLLVPRVVAVHSAPAAPGEKAEAAEEREDASVLVTMIRPLLPLAWAPDGSRLVFTHVVGEPRPGATDAQAGRAAVLEVVDAATGQRTPLPGPEGARLYPSWSPDGTRLAYAVEGPAPPAEPERERPEGGGARARRGVPPRPPAEELRPLDLYVAGADGAAPRKVWESRAQGRLYPYAAPGWTADGASLVALTLPPPGRGQPEPGAGLLPEVDVRVLPVDGTASRVLRRVPTPLVTLSRDLGLMAFNGEVKPGANHTGLMLSPSPFKDSRLLEQFATSPRALALDNLDTNQPPSLSPDARTVAIVIYDRGAKRYQLRLYDVATGQKAVHAVP